MLDSTAWVANFIVHLCTTERGAAKCVIALRINNAISLLDAYQYWSKVKLSRNLAVVKKLITYYNGVKFYSEVLFGTFKVKLDFNHFCS